MINIEKSKKLKFIYSLIFQSFIYILSDLFEFENIFIIVAINSFLYIIPFHVTLYIIRLNKADKLKRILNIDLIYYLIPSVLICPIYESIAVILTKKANESNGLFSIIMIIIFVLVYLMYMLIYKINIDKIKKHH